MDCTGASICLREGINRRDVVPRFNNIIKTSIYWVFINSFYTTTLKEWYFPSHKQKWGSVKQSNYQFLTTCKWLGLKKRKEWVLMQNCLKERDIIMVMRKSSSFSGLNLHLTKNKLLKLLLSFGCPTNGKSIFHVWLNFSTEVG